MTAIAMFPGQSSRYPEMIDKLAALPVAARILARASELLGRDLRIQTFATNRDVQVGVFLANHLHLALLEDQGVTFAWSLGLSLGEYNHLVHIGALTFDDALRFVELRGELYDHATGGKMVSIFPLEAAEIEAVIERLGLGAAVGIGLYNSPRQNVISGEASAVDRVVSVLEHDHYFDATVIEPRIPMHAPCFSRTARNLAAALDDLAVSAPGRPYLPNTLGELFVDATPSLIRGCLADHVDHPVRWKASVDAIAAQVSDPLFIEVGPRAVLHNLFGKDWMPGRRAKTDAAEGTRFESLAKELRDAA
jgi:[acyl-carrier-protein] S-malonyltransferase